MLANSGLMTPQSTLGSVQNLCRSFKGDQQSAKVQEYACQRMTIFILGSSCYPSLALAPAMFSAPLFSSLLESMLDWRSKV